MNNIPTIILLAGFLGALIMAQGLIALAAKSLKYQLVRWHTRYQFRGTVMVSKYGTIYAAHTEFLFSHAQAFQWYEHVDDEQA